MFRTDNYEQNYNRALDRGANFDTTCICCGRKLNPATMKEVQGLAPGYFVDTTVATIPERITETEHIEPMGWYSVGPVCYRKSAAVWPNPRKPLLLICKTPGPGDRPQ